MCALNDRIIWLHVTLPGQEAEANDLSIKKYPIIEELGEELILILDYFKILQVVCMGEGIGANISLKFALKYSNRCFGIILIQPICSSASFLESFKYKLSNLNIKNTNEKIESILSQLGKVCLKI